MKAVAQIKGADDGVKVVDTMKAIPTDDPLFGKGIIRVDGRKLHPMYLYKAKRRPTRSTIGIISSSSPRSNPRTPCAPWTKAGVRSSKHEGVEPRRMGFSAPDWLKAAGVSSAWR